MNRGVALVVSLLAGVAGCLTPTQRREDDLMREARTWNDDFRWERWDIVGQSMTPEENALFQARKNLVDADLVIADYEVTSVRFLQNSQAAMQQRWELRGGRWMMIKQRRVRGDRFPLVPEPVEEKKPATIPAPA
jgi:hypothetical protein